MRLCLHCRSVLSLLSWALTVCVLLQSARPQAGNQGSLEGVVTDPSGAVVARAEVEAKNLQTLVILSAVTNENGFFVFPVLPLGVYELTAQHPGFANLVLQGVKINVGGKVNLSLRLSLPSHSESIVVPGDPVVETARTSVNTTVDNRFVENLPVNGRDFSTLVLLTPGVTLDARGGYSFAGQRAMSSMLVDGANNDDTFWGQPESAPGFTVPGMSFGHISQESIQELRVNSNSYSAEFGRAGGGVIDVVTKSGTNEIHGSGYWFYRDQSMNANDPVNKSLGLPKNPFHYQQFGGSLGGPILKRRLFFFANYEGLRSGTSNPVFLNLPEGFQLDPDPVIAGFQQRALNYLQPRAIFWSRPLMQNDVLTRLDWQLRPNHLLTGHWSYARYTSEFNGGLQTSVEQSTPAPSSTDTFVLSLSSRLSPQWTNVALLSFAQDYLAFQASSINPTADVFEQGNLVLSVGRAPGTPQNDRPRRVQLADTVSHTHGQHNIKFGADVMLNHIRSLDAQTFAGNYKFSSLESFGRSLAGAPDPQPDDSYQQSFWGAGTPGPVARPNFEAFAGFIQDDWRVRPSLTLNLGLRYDLQLMDRPPVRNPSPALAAAGLDTSALPIDKTGFAPRAGVAWDPRGTGRLVLRAGYGIYYALTPALLTSRADIRNGISVQPRTFFGSESSAALIPAYPNNFCGPPDPTGALPTCAAPPLVGASAPLLQLFSSSYRQPFVQHASTGFEIQLGKDIALSSSYLLSKGTRLQRVRDANLGTPTTTEHIAIANTTTVLSYQEFTLPRPIADFDRTLLFESSASSIYHGLMVQVKKRFSQNLQFLGSYTLGKVIDDNPNVYALGIGPANANLVADPSRPVTDRGPGSNDQRERLVLSGVWELNYGKSLPRGARAVLQGWRFSGILAAQTGQPYSGHLYYDLNGDGVFGTDRVPGLGRNTFYAPVTVSFDPRISRIFAVGEHLSLQISAEAFNVFNRANIVGVNDQYFGVADDSSACGVAGNLCLVPNNEGLSAFGSPAFSSGPRIVQLSVRLAF
jgi:hypothetical protein